MIMAHFPAMVSMPARCCEPGDVLRGRQGMFTGTFMTFQYAVTVTEVTATLLYGVNGNGSKFSMPLIGKSDVLIELKKASGS